MRAQKEKREKRQKAIDAVIYTTSKTMDDVVKEEEETKEKQKVQEPGVW